jgi:AcrR family transcriptional regulator
MSRPAALRPPRASRTTVAVRDPEASRARILDAATAEFARHGFGGARVDRIAGAAAANKRMLYYYFGNKEALFRAVLERTYEGIRAAERELSLADLPPEEGIRRLVEFTWDYFLRHPEFIRLLNTENLHAAHHLKRSAQIRSMNSPLIATLRTLLARGRRSGAFRGGVDALQLYISIAALSYFFLSNSHTLSTVFGRDLSSPAERKARLAHMIDLVLGYLRRPAGRAVR